MRHGVLLIDKPLHVTSAQAVTRVRRVLGERHIGHLGTLDPLAQGLLVLFVGSKALKVVECFQQLPKQYLAEVTLGKVSTTYDREGVITEVPRRPGWLPPTRKELQEFLRRRFLGTIEYTPPAFSALKVQGTRAYTLARRGTPPLLPTRTATVSEIDIVTYDHPLLLLRLTVSAGTYIRSLAQEIGHVLRCGGFLSSLIRTRVGPWALTQAVPPESASWGRVLPLHEVLGEEERMEVTEEEATLLCHGRPIPQRIACALFAWHRGLPIALLEPDPTLPGMARPRKVL